MALQPSIILSGNALDVVGSLDRGMVAGQRVAEQRQKNALREFYQTNGAGIMSGDPQALNALAGIDPDAAMKVQAQRLDQDRVRLGMDATKLNMRQAEQQMAMLSREEARAVEDRAAQMTAAERAAAAERLQQAATMGLQAQSPEQFDQIMSSMGMDQYVGQFANREILAARGMSTADAFKRYDEANAAPTPLSPEGKLAADVQAGLVDPSSVRPETSAAEEQISRIMETGVDRQTAILIADGVIKVNTDPVTREVTLVDTRDFIAQGDAPQQTPSASPQPQTAPQPQPQTLTYGDQYPAAGQAFGVGGAVRRGVNTVADTLGAEAPFPEVEATQADFAVLKESILNDIASGYNRQPPSWLLQNIERLVPEAGSITRGPGRAQSQLRALGRSFDGELATVENELQGRRLSPTDRANLEDRRTALRTAKSRVDSALNAFEAEDGGNVTSSGIKWSVE